MSPVKVVLLSLLALAMLYVSSVAVGMRSGPGDPHRILASIPSSDWIKSLADRFGTGFDFNSIHDPHASGKTRTITILRGQTVLISLAANQERKSQRLQLADGVPDCEIEYSDLYIPPHQSRPDPQHADCANARQTFAVTDKGGVLKVSCHSKSRDCVLKVK